MGRLIFILLFISKSALGTDVPSIDIPPIDLSAIIPDTAIAPILQTIGILTEHRPYSPATCLPSRTLEPSLEISLVHLPKTFATAFSSLGSAGGGSDSSSSSSGEFPIPSLPTAKLHLRVGLTEKWEAGASALYFPGILFWGADLKRTIYSSEEGLTYGARFVYSSAGFDFNALGINPLKNIEMSGVSIGSANLLVYTDTYSPQIVISKPLDFAEPYAAVSYEYTRGYIQIPITIDVLGETQTLTTKTYSIGGAVGTMGVRFSGLLFKFVLEGSYSTMGMHTLGINLGLSL